jgi:hypothetical protein
MEASTFVNKSENTLHLFCSSKKNQRKRTFVVECDAREVCVMRKTMCISLSHNKQAPLPPIHINANRSSLCDCLLIVCLLLLSSQHFASDQMHASKLYACVGCVNICIRHCHFICDTRCSGLSLRLRITTLDTYIAVCS